MVSHLCIGEKLLVFAFDILSKIGVVGRVVANRFGRVFGFEGFEAEKVLHREFELRFAILATTAVLIETYRLLR